MRTRELWYSIKDRDRAGAALVALANKYKDQFSARKTRAVNLLANYEGLAISDFSQRAYDTAEGYEYEFNSDPDKKSRHEMVWNLGAAIMDGIDAKIFGLDRTKTAFVVSEGGWDAKRSAIMAGRFIEGQMAEPQGIFPDLWAAWRHGARLATVSTTACAMFFFADVNEGKVVAELDDTLNMFVETSGLPYDGFSSIGRVTYWDPDKLARKFHKFKDQIYAAAEKPTNELAWLEEQGGDNPPDEVRRVPLVQGWRMQQGLGSKHGGVDGSYCAAIPGATLDMAPYPEQEPPCVFFVPRRQLAGTWGRTELERILGPLRRVNQILGSLDDAERLTPKGVVYYDPTVIDPATIATVKNVVGIPYNGPPEKRPIYEPPAPFHPLHLELLKLHKDACYDLIRMSEAQVTAQREKGLSSGVAIRLVQNQGYEAFAPIEDEYTQCVGPRTARQYMRCARELQKAGKGKFVSTWKGGGDNGFLREIDAGVFDILDKHKYRAEPQAVSGNQNTPADRMELAQELMEAGVITGEAFASISQHFDVHGTLEQGLNKAEEAFVMKQIDCWLYDPIEEAETYFQGPEKFMNSPALLLQVGAAYLQAKMDMSRDLGDPEVIRRLQCFLRFIKILQKHIDEKDARAAQLQAQAQGQGQAPAAPAAPQMAA